MVKVTHGEGDRFAARPPTETLAFLIYGTDEGVIGDRADRIEAALRARNPGLDCEHIDERRLREEPGYLRDELASASLFAPRRLMTYRHAGGQVPAGLSAAIAHIEDGATDFGDSSYLLVTAGELAPASALRSAFEQGKRTAALACYADTDAQLRTVIRAMVEGANLSIDQAALDLLVDARAEDRRVYQAEIEKLILLKTATGTGAITSADVISTIGDLAAAAPDRLAAAVFGGKPAAIDRELQAAFAEGESEIGLLRAVLRTALDVRVLDDRLTAGDGEEQALRRIGLSRYHPRARLVLGTRSDWSGARIDRAIARLVDLEVALKQTGAAGEPLLSMTLMSLGR